MIKSFNMTYWQDVVYVDVFYMSRVSCCISLTVNFAAIHNDDFETLNYASVTALNIKLVHAENSK